jgi:glycosyltransferase involved in cell wall biosynthesis
MSNHVEISVVIPAKNRALTLAGCLDSVLAQTYPASEIVVVDDGSIDNTKEVVESYANRKVRYARLPTGRGAQAARNYGVEIARSEWIAFQDSDDLWLPHKLAIQVEALEAHELNSFIVVHGDGLKMDQTSNLEKPLPVPFTAGKCYEKLLLQAAPMFQALLASKTAILEAGGLDNDCPSYQEWDTAIRLARICEFVHIQQPLFIWNWHAGETISKDFRRDIRGFDYVIRKRKAEIIATHGQRAWRQLKMKNIARTLSAKSWDEVETMLLDETPHRSVSMARLFAKAQVFPIGAGRLLRLMSI